MTTANPPNRRKAPLMAQEPLDFMSLGVIWLKHCSGLVAKGMINASYRHKVSQNSLMRRHDVTHFKEYHSQRQADAEIMSVCVLDWQNGKGKK
jgi:hypothetical protein